ncbi:MAG: DUF1349 domain-containing protein [Erysipelothrix sp.]|nr:DUF1349 domain-containing protein [Erysipelothrix sp.]
MKNFLQQDLFWINEPETYEIKDGIVTITSDPETDLWSKTYYNNSEDNAPMLLHKTKEQFFTFSFSLKIKPTYEFDQAGIIIFEDSDNWAKCSAEFIDPEKQLLGSVVTNLGYSDWSTKDIPGDTEKIYYRLSRRESDFLFESSLDGANFEQMRIFHMHTVEEEVSFGIYIASPWDVRFDAEFSDLKIGPNLWQAH